MEEKIDRRIKKSQEAIQASFLEMLGQTEFDAITVKDIADRANISRKTFYLHYVDKYDLLNTLVGRHLDDLAVICEEKKGKDLIESTIIWFRYFERHKDFFAILFASESTVSFRYQLLDFIENQFENKLENIPASPEKEILRKFMGMAVLGIVESFVLAKLDADMVQIARKVGEILSTILTTSAAC